MPSVAIGQGVAGWLKRSKEQRHKCREVNIMAEETVQLP